VNRLLRLGGVNDQRDADGASPVARRLLPSETSASTFRKCSFPKSTER